MATTYRYPDLLPVGSEADAGLSGLGVNWNKGGEGLTPWVDYICFKSYKPTYNGKAVLESIREESKSGDAAKTNRTDGDIVFLYMPSNIAVNYSAMYNSTKFGVGGIAAAQMLGGNGGAEEVAGTLQNAAAGATPEAGFKAVSSAANAITQFLDLEGNISGNDLAAVSQGRIFNPYEEQIFNGITFRSHSFQFKLVARDKKEAETIQNIIRTFKTVMLPSYNQSISDVSGAAAAAKTGADSAKDSTSKDGSLADKLTPPFSNIKNRYLNVPSRVEVDFVRISRSSFNNDPVKSTSSIEGLFKMKHCVIDGLQVNYTPDGGYVNTNEGYVPAIDLSLSLKEISLVTADDVKGGF